LGIISPVGSTVDSAWRDVVGGVSGIGALTQFDVSAFPVRFGGSVKDFNCDDYIPPKEQRRMDPFMQYGVAASLQAFKDASLTVTDQNAPRIGVLVGAGIGGLFTIEETNEKYNEAKSPKKISPFFIPASIINMVSGHVSIMCNLKGPNLAVVTACTTSTHAIGLAARLIQYGDADAMIAGGAEFATTPLGLGGFAQSRALSQRNDDPTRASRPWDQDRDGFVLSNGAGAIVLEEYEHAKARGAKIYAEFIGFGMSADAHHITAPPANGEGARAAMTNALRDAALNPSDIQYINAHATSTELGDVAETNAIKGCFGEHAYKVAVSSTKSVTGHLLGAAGVVEAIFTILALRDQIIPPTINLDAPGEGCDLDYVPKIARKTQLNAAISNSFGFGGTNGSVIFRTLK